MSDERIRSLMAKLVEAEAEIGRLRAAPPMTTDTRNQALRDALVKIKSIPLGPDRGSAQWNVDLAVEIATKALAMQEPASEPAPASADCCGAEVAKIAEESIFAPQGEYATACREIAARLRARASCRCEPAPASADCFAARDAIAMRERVQHVKRGSTYQVIGEAELQAAWPVIEGAKITVYRCETNGRFWARPTMEFRDGRFAALTPSSEGEP